MTELRNTIAPGQQPEFVRRSGQKEFEDAVGTHRVCGLLARRQYGKTTIAARIALKKMMKWRAHTVIFGSVKLDLGREIVRKEADAMLAAYRVMAQQAQQKEGLLGAFDERGKSVGGASAEDFASLYEACRLEFRYYHNRTSYSRTKVVALTPSAVGETGDLILDEVGRVKNFREVVEAVMPIIASNPDFRCIYTTTPPPDDTHYSFELLAPPIEAELPVNPKGNWYVSELGVHVLRITAADAYADLSAAQPGQAGGVPLYDDDTGAALSPEESRAKAHDKDAWDRNYGCRFVMGGTAACGLLQLDSAQRRGMAAVSEYVGESVSETDLASYPDPTHSLSHSPTHRVCRLFQINDEGDFADAIDQLPRALGAGAIGLGWDLATTTSESSNPSAFAIMEQRGVELIVPAILVWKTADPALAMERARRIVEAIRCRPEGGPARRLAVDATNERYFAQSVRAHLAAAIPVELVVASETKEVPGREEKISVKQILGGALVAELEDNHLSLPPERYLREDWRLVRREKGQFVCEPDGSGRHGDTFDAAKLALHALRSTAGGISTLDGVYTGGNAVGARPQFRPATLHPALRDSTIPAGRPRFTERGIAILCR